MPLLDDAYNFEDALLVGGMLITLLRNSDRVKIACLAQLVNVIAPIMTSRESCWAQTIYWPFMHVSQYGRGTALRPIIKSPRYSSSDYDDVPFVDAAAVLAENGSLSIFVLNRSIDCNIELSCDLRAFGDLCLEEHIILHHNDIKAVNTEREPDKIIPRTYDEHEADSQGNNNGSAFAGLHANTPFYNITGGLAMLIGRYWLAVPTLALAGSLARKRLVPASDGTLPTHTPLFVVWVVITVLLLGALSFVPALALGPIVEHLQMISM